MENGTATPGQTPPAPSAPTDAATTTTPATYHRLCWNVADSLDQLRLFQCMMCYVNPALSILGFGSNMMSLAILARSGLRRPSNVLLFGLVIADSMCLMMTMNFALIIVYFGPDKLKPAMCGYQYAEGVNYFLAASALVFNFVGYWGRYVNTLIPVFITLERLLAVFRPIAFKSLVSAKLAAYAVAFSFLFWLPWTLFITSVYEIYQRPISDGVTWMIVSAAVWYTQSVETVDIFENYVIDTLVSWVPLSLVIFGCSALSVKVKMALARRKIMTSASWGKLAWSPRTTRTLICTCLVFAITHASTSALMYATPEASKMAVLIRNLFIHFLYTANSSSNLFLYVASNRNLLAIFVKIVRCAK